MFWAFHALDSAEGRNTQFNGVARCGITHQLKQIPHRTSNVVACRRTCKNSLYRKEQKIMSLDPSGGPTPCRAPWLQTAP